MWYNKAMRITGDLKLSIRSDFPLQDNCGIVYASSVEGPHGGVVGWLERDASLDEAKKYIKSLSGNKFFDVNITFVPFVSKQTFMEAYPFLIPTITWKTNGEVSIDASINSKYRNRYLPRTL